MFALTWWSFPFGFDSLLYGTRRDVSRVKVRAMTDISASRSGAATKNL
jgi:hypothetical protein